MNGEAAQSVKLSKYTASLELTPFQCALKRAHDPELTSFAMGLPDIQLFPSEELAAAASNVLHSNKSILQYAEPCVPLKWKICEYMRVRGVDCTVDDVLLTQGAQQAVNLLVRLFVNSESLVMEEEISYSGFQHLIDEFNVSTLGVPTNSGSGIDVNALKVCLEKGKAPAFIYLMPTAHNPLGVNLSPDKRTALVRLAEEFCFPIIEDDPYGTLCYDSAPPLSLKSLNSDKVYYAGSFSKLLGPSLRIGWIVAPSEHIQKLSVLKEGSDLDVNTLSQWIANEYLEHSNFQYYLTKICAIYKERRNTMEASLTEWMPQQVTWHKPSCGIFFWLELPKHVDSGALLEECADEAQVAFLPSGACSRQRHKNAMRINFSRHQPERIAAGIKRLGIFLSRKLSSRLI